MFEKSEAFDLYISELLDEKLSILSATDGKYAEAKTKAAFDVEVLERNFGNQAFTDIEDFHSILNELSAIENKYLYFQGFQDCVQLLKRLEVY